MGRSQDDSTHTTTATAATTATTATTATAAAATATTATTARASARDVSAEALQDKRKRQHTTTHPGNDPVDSAGNFA